MPTLLPKDDNNFPLPALRLKEDGAHAIEATSTSTCNTTAFDDQTKIISLYATGPVYIRFGTSSSVTATSSDHYFPEGVYYNIATGGDKVAHYTHIAVICANYDCQLYISEKQ